MDKHDELWSPLGRWTDRYLDVDIARHRRKVGVSLRYVVEIALLFGEPVGIFGNGEPGKTRPQQCEKHEGQRAGKAAQLGVFARPHAPGAKVHRRKQFFLPLPHSGFACRSGGPRALDWQGFWAVRANQPLNRI